jgi:hypothetical protein
MCGFVDSDWIAMVRRLLYSYKLIFLFRNIRITFITTHRAHVLMKGYIIPSASLRIFPGQDSNLIIILTCSKAQQQTLPNNG